MHKYTGNEISSCLLNINHHNEIINNKFDKGTVNILYLNTRSLIHKLNDVENLIENFPATTEIICISESWLESTHNKFFNIKGYQSFHSNRVRNTNLNKKKGIGGGVSIFVKDTIRANIIHEEDFERSNFLVVYLPDLKIHLICVYRSQKTIPDIFLKKFENIISNFPKSMILGDFNFDLLKPTNKHVKDYTELLNSNGYVILNKTEKKYATRIAYNKVTKNTSYSILDHILTDKLNHKFNFFTSDTSLSDHKLLFLQFSISNQNTKPLEQISITITDYDEITRDEIWNNINNFNTLEELSISLQEVINKNKKIKTKTIKPHKNPWVTEELLDLINKREKYHKLRKKYPLSTYVNEKYEELRNTVTMENKLLQKSHNSQTFNDCMSSPKKYWEKIKEILFNKIQGSNNNKNLSIKEDNSLINDPKKVADIFNNFFVNISNQSPINISQTQKINITQQFNLTPVSPEEITLYISEINSTSATGMDDISAKFLKNFCPKLNVILAKLINKSINNGIFPNNLKIARVVPVFKTGDSLNPSNYRPISVLNSLSKIFEKCLYKRLSQHLDNNSILSQHQYGFTQGSNTTAACVNLTQYITTELDKKQHVSCVFLDIRKAFDTVNHRLLCKKIKQLKLPKHIYKVLKTYLLNRPQIVAIGTKNSDPRNIINGVPQGSILGPLLFSIFINDITHIKLKGKIQLYADDTVLKYSSRDINTIFQEMQHDIDLIANWFNTNQLDLNVSKTKYMFFTNCKINMETIPILSYQNQTISRVNSFKYLGLIIDDKLSWSNHIDHIKSKIIPYIFTIRKLKHLLPRNTLLSIYFSYIYSQLIYLIPIWSCTSQYKITELLILQKRALKYIYNLPKRYPTHDLFTKFKETPSLLTLAKIEDHILINKLVNNKLKHNLEIQQISQQHRYGHRRRSHFVVSFFNTNIGEKNILHRGLRAYNALPSEIRNETNIIKFKKIIKNHIVNNC